MKRQTHKRIENENDAEKMERKKQGGLLFPGIHELV